MNVYIPASATHLKGAVAIRLQHFALVFPGFRFVNRLIDLPASSINIGMYQYRQASISAYINIGKPQTQLVVA